MVDTKIPRTTYVSQLVATPYMISPLFIENQFHPLPSVDGEKMREIQEGLLRYALHL